MRRRHVIGIALAALAAGCMDVSQSLTINADGGGTLALTYNVPEQTIVQINGMLTLRQRLSTAAGESAVPEEPDFFTRLILCANEDQIRQLFKTVEGRGITVDELEFDNRNASRRAKLKLTYNDLARLAVVGLWPERRMVLMKTETGDYDLVLRSTVLDPGKVPEVVSGSDMARELQPLMAGFRAELKIRTPSEIVRSTAPRKTAQTVTWTFDFDRDPRCVTALQIDPITVTFQGKGLDLNAFDSERDGAPRI